ncbi:RNA-binding protein [Schizosaccharomyces pombe]|uniref:Uncharacterized RNA-binding protein C644.16 n=1 Tax=Schizosaccharomyces pombe (strain 972 / ATCC 24843) TaxID=284812 RepID=YKCG_SCHPO|nr:putative RNA-binding protein [Schizosaccharomyces pombe]Q9P6P7.1 RecName: Full=Uncharacterized RNA-binding protein C644.16 [Schizosaccharomyces pombe 972h-]CAB90143.1 RNA-binding protein (predicted) [Schizosaccharomyces pombe]|eukprot:NP_593884.1 putative RNA-binding protein [Schizosaccharomyces pombe]
MNPSCVVYVGNIPYEMAEEQVIDIFKQSGPVKSFQLVIDPESGQPKGYGFCEYHDPATAASAVRNLNNYDAGTRRLRVDFPTADQIRRLDKLLGPSRYGYYPQSYANQSYTYGNNFGSYPPTQPSTQPLPQSYGYPSYPPAGYRGGSARPSGVLANDEVYRVLAQLAPNEIDYMLSAIKALCLEAPEQAAQLFETNPQLSYAVFQAMLMKRYTSESVVADLLIPAGVNLPGAQEPNRGYFSPMHTYSSAVPGPISVPSAPYGRASSTIAEVSPMYGSHAAPYASTPSAAVGSSRGSTPASATVPISPARGFPTTSAYNPAPPAYGMANPAYGSTGIRSSSIPSSGSIRSPSLTTTSAQATTNATNNITTTTAAQDENATKAALIAQLMALTDDQINVLPPDQKERILQIRQALPSSYKTESK